MKFAIAVALLGLLAVLSPVADARKLMQSAPTDADILNFALNLEVSKRFAKDSCKALLLLLCILPLLLSTFSLTRSLLLQCLEAQFYSCAVYGQPLSDQLTGYGPRPIGCQQANFTNDDIYSIAMDGANNEIAHVRYLRTALGNSSVQCPLVNIGDAFSAAANAALGTTLSPPFVPYVNDLYFLTGAFIFEDLGVTAYEGALGGISSLDIKLAAAGKHSHVLTT